MKTMLNIIYYHILSSIIILYHPLSSIITRRKHESGLFPSDSLSEIRSAHCCYHADHTLVNYYDQSGRNECGHFISGNIKSSLYSSLLSLLLSPSSFISIYLNIPSLPTYPLSLPLSLSITFKSLFTQGFALIIYLLLLVTFICIYVWPVLIYTPMNSDKGK